MTAVQAQQWLRARATGGGGGGGVNDMNLKSPLLLLFIKALGSQTATGQFR